MIAIFCTSYAQGREWAKENLNLPKTLKDMNFLLFYDYNGKEQLKGLELNGFIMLPGADHRWVSLAYSQIRNW